MRHVRALAILLALVTFAGCFASANQDVKPAAASPSSAGDAGSSSAGGSSAAPASGSGSGSGSTVAPTPPTAPVSPAAAPVAPVAPGPLISFRGASVAGAARWSGMNLTAKQPALQDQIAPGCTRARCPPVALDCAGSNCETLSFDVRVPDGWWATHDGGLRVAIRWPTVISRQVQLAIEDANGAILDEPRQDQLVGSVGSVAIVDKPASGSYRVVVEERAGAGVYEGAAWVESRAVGGAVHDLLPDLTVLPPTDLTLTTPDVYGFGYFQLVQLRPASDAVDKTGSVGCRSEEVAQDHAKKCLRFSNAVGNLGAGPLDIRLTLKDGATSPAGGHFTQLVHRSDGTTTETPGGPAEFHAFHGHWHNAASERYDVYPYDPVTGARGASIGKGTKAGVCFADIGLVDVGLLNTARRAQDGYGCFAPADGQSWSMGLDPGWYDLYPETLEQQYVEISAAKDGTYELCSVVNVDHLLRESDPANNEACTPFRLAGDTVTLLSPAPYHTAPPGEWG